jgi:hypothetical protein
MKNTAIILLTLALLSSCKMQQLYLNVVEPAPVTLPPGLKTAGVIDRSAPTEEVKAADVLDKVLSLEGANLDKEGAKACMEGLTNELKGNPRFESVSILPASLSPVAFSGIFPPPLSWDEIEKTCREYSVDALFSLEMFDTDTRISYQIRKGGTPKTLLGAVTGIEQQADMLTVVKSGWRLYYPAGKRVLDQFMINDDLNFSATGLTPVIAAAALIDRKEAVKKVSLNAGHLYAARILPYQIRVSRDYYVKGTDRFKTAMRKARTGNWDQAGDLWFKETENGDSKIAGRACYNMAIISEINGNLDTAIEWAMKSYEDYNNRKALNYVNILKYRRQSNYIIEEQQK